MGVGLEKKKLVPAHHVGEGSRFKPHRARNWSPMHLAMGEKKISFSSLRLRAALLFVGPEAASQFTT